MPSTPLVWPPALKISKSSFGLSFHQSEFEAPMSRMVGVFELNEGKTDRWEGAFTLPGQSFRNGSLLLGFLAALKAGQGTFYGFDPDRLQPSTKNGAFPGNGVVDGGGQTGRSLETKGWPASVLILGKGDLIQVNSQVLEISNDVSTNGFGKASLAFQPALRANPSDNDTVITTNPVFIARLKDREIFAVSNQTHSLEQTIHFEEVI